MKCVAHVARLTSFISSFGVFLILNGQILAMHAGHKQAMPPYKLIITQQKHY
jgi:hypothetical protein